MTPPRRVLWITDRLEGGGAERYVRSTPPLLRTHGVESMLLYSVEQPMSASLAAPFDAAFPLVDLERQLQELSPDLVYLHKVSTSVARTVAMSGARSIRFVHDHAMFCLREHKYTAVGSQPCARRVGPGCYACTGFIRREPQSRKLALATLDPLREAWRVLGLHDAIVVGSRYMAEHVVEHGLPRSLVHAVPLFGPSPEMAPESARVGGEALFVGALTTGKGVDVLLRATAIAPAVRHLTIVGDGPQREELQRLAARLRLGSRVTFTGSLPASRVAELYARAACMVLPSRQPETFGMVGVEAMAHGVPVVATAIGGTTEWLRDGETGMTVPANAPRALAAAMESVLVPAIGDRLGRQARAVYTEFFTPQRHAERLLSVFEAVLEARSAA